MGKFSFTYVIIKLATILRSRGPIAFSDRGMMAVEHHNLPNYVYLSRFLWNNVDCIVNVVLDIIDYYAFIRSFGCYSRPLSIGALAGWAKGFRQFAQKATKEWFHVQECIIIVIPL